MSGEHTVETKRWPDGTVTVAGSDYAPIEGLVWPVERAAVPEIAAALYAQINWGREPHPSQVSEVQMRAWESVRARWEAATLAVLTMMQEAKNLKLYP